ncbi:hypothetical protein ACXYMU_16665 [Pontibacter sp. CAU 1760]
MRQKDLTAFGACVRKSFEAQLLLFPHMANPDFMHQIGAYAGDVLGWKLSGAGGGGYIILVSEKPVKDAIQVKICRRDNL